MPYVADTVFPMVSDRVRGACPSVHAPFLERDGALVRVRLPGGRLPVAAARELAAVADRAGAGAFELTNRANLQLRGIPVDEVPRVRDSLVAAEVTPDDADADARRNVLASPTAGVDAEELVDTRPLVDALATRLAGSAPAPPSHKFGVLVDGGGAVHLRGRRHDLALGAVRMLDGELEYEVALGAPLPLTQEAGAVVRVVRPDRAVDLLDAVLAGAGVDALVDRRRASDVASVITPSVPAVGVHRQRDTDRVWIGAVPVLGRLDAGTLAALADLAVGELRVTPWRGVVLVDVPAAGADAVVHALDGLGLVLDAAHPANAVVACVGSRGCAAGFADTQRDARALIDRLAATPVGQRPASVHVSGCEKGCARATPAEVSFVATAPHRYDRYSGDPTVLASQRPDYPGAATPKPVGLELGRRFGELVERGCRL
jgi:precorrin-3B synthase